MTQTLFSKDLGGRPKAATQIYTFILLVLLNCDLLLEGFFLILNKNN